MGSNSNYSYFSISRTVVPEYPICSWPRVFLYYDLNINRAYDNRRGQKDDEYQDDHDDNHDHHNHHGEHRVNGDNRSILRREKGAIPEDRITPIYGSSPTPHIYPGQSRLRVLSVLSLTVLFRLRDH